MPDILDQLKTIDQRTGKFVEEPTATSGPAITQEPSDDEKRNVSMNVAEEAFMRGENPALAYIQSYMKPQRDVEREQRIKQAAYINTIGQNLTNIIDAIQGSKGARIPIRQDQTTNRLMEALASEETKYKADEQRYENAMLDEMIRKINFDREEGRYKEKLAVEAEERENLKNYREAQLEQDQQRIDIAEKEANAIIQAKKDAEAEKKEKEEKADKEYYSVAKNVGQGKPQEKVKIDVKSYGYILRKVQEMPAFEDDDLVVLLKEGKASKPDFDRIVDKYWDTFFDEEDGVLIPKSGGPTLEGYGDIYESSSKTQNTNPLGLPTKTNPLGIELP